MRMEQSPPSGKPRKMISFFFIPWVSRTRTASSWRSTPYSRKSSAVGGEMGSSISTPPGSPSPLVMKTTFTAPFRPITRWMSPPTPRVSSSGCGEMTRRRVERERSPSSVGGPSARTAGERSKARVQRKTTDPILQPGIMQKFAQQLVRREVFRGDLACGVSVSGVIGVNGLQGGERLLRGGEGKQPASGGNIFAEARLLGHDRPPSRQVTHAAVAEPATAGPHHRVFRDGELPARVADVPAVEVEVLGHGQGVGQQPAAAP